MAACSILPASPAKSALSDAPTATFNGDWDDTDAAVDVGAWHAEAFVVSIESPTPNVRRYAIRTAADQPGVLIVERVAPASGSAPQADPIDLRLTCSVGEFGNPREEDRILSCVRARFSQLRGVDFAPLTR